MYVVYRRPTSLHAKDEAYGASCFVCTYGRRTTERTTISTIRDMRLICINQTPRRDAGLVHKWLMAHPQRGTVDQTKHPPPQQFHTYGSVRLCRHTTWSRAGKKRVFQADTKHTGT